MSARYAAARKLAREIALANAQVRYILHFYTEDQQHAGVQTGTRFVEVSAVVALMATTEIKIVVPDTLSSRVAMRNTKPEHMVCRVTVVRMGGDTSVDAEEPDGTLHQFESTSTRSVSVQTRSGDARMGTFLVLTVPDNTPLLDGKPDGAKQPDWRVAVELVGSTQIASVEFTHESDDHSALVDRLLDESTEANIDLALSLLRDEACVAPKPQLLVADYDVKDGGVVEVTIDARGATQKRKLKE